jgi:hypothetical protein
MPNAFSVDSFVSIRSQGCRFARHPGLKLANAFGVFSANFKLRHYQTFVTLVPLWLIVLHCTQIWISALLFLGFGGPVAKSVALLRRSWQPFARRSRAFVLLAAGAGAEPLKQLTVLP